MTDAARAVPDTPEARSKAATIGIAMMAILLLFGAVVQYNDPDPLGWMALYLAAAGVSFAALRGPQAWPVAAAIAAAAVVWAATLVPAAARTSFLGLFRSWEMMSTEMEEGREFLGLLLVATWTSYLACRGCKAPREEQS